MLSSTPASSAHPASDTYSRPFPVVLPIGIQLRGNQGVIPLKQRIRDLLLQDMMRYPVQKHGCHIDLAFFPVGRQMVDSQQLLKYAVRDSFVTDVTRIYKHRFLWLRWGTKGYQVHHVNFNPNVDVKYNQFIMIKK